MIPKHIIEENWTLKIIMPRDGIMEISDLKNGDAKRDYYRGLDDQKQ